MVFGYRQPIIREPVGADRRALHDMRDVAIGAQTTEGIGPGETEHIDHRVEALRLEGALERRPLTPVSPHQAGPRGDRAPQAAIDTGHRMALGQQHAHDTRTDMPRAPNDTDVHRVAPPAAHCSTSGPDVQDGVCGPKRRTGLCQHSLGRHRLKNDARLWLDARVVDGLRWFKLMLVTLSSMPFFGHGLEKGWHFSDTVGAEAPGIQEARESFWTSMPMESVLDCGRADLRVRVSAVASWGSGFLHAHPRVSRRSASRLGSHEVSTASYLWENTQIEEIRERLTRLETSCLCDARRRYCLDPAIRPVSLGVKLVGRAFTVACCNDFLTVIKALQDAAPGDVLVVDGQQGRTALAGELFATEANAEALPASWSTAPCAMATIRAMQFPVYCRHSSY